MFPLRQHAQPDRRTRPLRRKLADTHDEGGFDESAKRLISLWEGLGEGALAIVLVMGNPGRYVGAEEVADDGDPFEEKMPRLVAELHAQFAESAKLEKAIKKSLGGLGYEF